MCPSGTQCTADRGQLSWRRWWWRQSHRQMARIVPMGPAQNARQLSVAASERPISHSSGAFGGDAVVYCCLAGKSFAYINFWHLHHHHWSPSMDRGRPTTMHFVSWAFHTNGHFTSGFYCWSIIIPLKLLSWLSKTLAVEDTNHLKGQGFNSQRFPIMK